MKYLDDQTFDTEMEKSKLPVLVYFFAEWCGPCKAVSPVVEEIANSYSKSLDVFKVNVDKASNVTRDFNIMGIPNLLFFDKNKESVKQITGFADKETIIRHVKEIVL